MKQLEELRGSSERLESELLRVRKRAEGFKEQAEQEEQRELRRCTEELSGLKASYAEAMVNLEAMKQHEVGWKERMILT